MKKANSTISRKLIDNHIIGYFWSIHQYHLHMIKTNLKRARVQIHVELHLCSMAHYNAHAPLQWQAYRLHFYLSYHAEPAIAFFKKDHRAPISKGVVFCCVFKMDARKGVPKTKIVQIHFHLPFTVEGSKHKTAIYYVWICIWNFKCAPLVQKWCAYTKYFSSVYSWYECVRKVT